ncbi:UDP-glucose--hexose-1-phosphate uridylyltransferase [Lactococcus nasutitermitis]|uniref:Galactose-1-phosphate uridylyltransferase n=1 Tax=Lactococcus nasutitermitis TaxID=1652957 RepID=A0ABV9JEF6_9LACT|nr:UDP-glucose--hexose-1-phosphate uridylyltransferase [Lactococcus nasutitermitis]
MEELTIYQVIENFIQLGVENGTIQELDVTYLRNQLLHFIGIDDWQIPKEKKLETDSLLLMDRLLAYAQEKGKSVEEEKEAYEAALMDFITPAPSKINMDFWEKYQHSPDKATDYFYTLAKQVNQVKTRDIARNILFKHQTKYGELEITINLSKPEKDPKAIAAEKERKIQSISYPLCQLCMENEGFFGGNGQAARSNHRIVRLKLGDEEWGLQYSPYAYYNEHSIVLNEKHQPMKINQKTFVNLFSFLEQFPHYMIGSNADLPIVGGSILTHDHYQAGRHDFPMAKTDIREKVKLKDFPEMSAGILNWPMSVLRLTSARKEELIEASQMILEKWKIYDDKDLNILSQTSDGVVHHTITPIAYKHGESYEINLVLRDNNVSDEFPDGIFHPHPELHHIKKENIGLIEVMGLAILPPRLKEELKEVEKYLINESNEMKAIHQRWVNELKSKDNFTPENVEKKVREAVGEVFSQVLQDAGVFKDNQKGQDGFRRFIAFLNK